MQRLIDAIHKTPIIDHHAHPLLALPARNKHPLLSITTEAHGDAIQATRSSLAHLRAVKQLAEVLNCPSSWQDVTEAIAIENGKPGDSWSKRCLDGIEILFLDDGLEVYYNITGTSSSQVSVFHTDFRWFAGTYTNGKSVCILSVRLVRSLLNSLKAGAATIELLSIFTVLFTFYGWWRLGRHATLSPLEIAKVSVQTP